MGKVLRERHGIRQFEKLTRWNTLDYTLISRNSTFAKYSDDPDSKGAKLCLTRFGQSAVRGLPVHAPIQKRGAVPSA